uniref:Prolyl 4-hydroxylase alpha subunit domain-containing protein n=1 Tax=Cuerna arida TaxID=1464854 RepID=A0A1B6GHL1_9HEMI
MLDKKIVVLLSTTLLIVLTSVGVVGQFLPLSALEKYYDLERKLFDHFETHIKQQKSLLNILKTRYKKHLSMRENVTDAEAYISNPLNMLSLMRRMTADWSVTLALLNRSNAVEERILPAIKEYTDALDSINKLQQVYQIDMNDMSSGVVFQNTHKTSRLTESDYLYIGQHLYSKKQFSDAMRWFKMAVGKHAKDDEQTKDGKRLSEKLLEYLALTSCFVGDQEGSAHYFQKLYYGYPDFHPSKDLIDHHISTLNTSCVELADGYASWRRDNEMIPGLSKEEDVQLTAQYQAACRGTLSPMESPLYCYLHSTPPLVLMPMKVEILHLDPPISMIHDFLPTKERKFFINIAMSKEEPWRYRGLVSRWWEYFKNLGEYGKKLIKRVANVIPLRVYNAFMITNLPVAADDYIVHHVAIGEDQQSVENRKASLMIYLEKPKEGGSLVFPQLGLSVTPNKGAAVLWYNLHPDGQVDLRTIHGHCPILRGNAWVLTVWLGRRTADLSLT